MAQDPTPNLFAIQDLQSRQAHKVTWDALNALRTEKRVLAESVTALQSQVGVLQSGATASAKLPAIISALNSEVDVAQDHPYLLLVNSATITTTTGLNKILTWDTELVATPTLFHSTTVDSDKVFIGRKPGLWLSVLSLAWTANAAGTRHAEMRGDNSLPFVATRENAIAGFTQYQSLTGLIYTTGPNDPHGGSYLTARAFQDSGGNLDVVEFAGGGATSWAFYYLAAPAVGTPR